MEVHLVNNQTNLENPKDVFVDDLIKLNDGDQVFWAIIQKKLRNCLFAKIDNKLFNKIVQGVQENETKIKSVIEKSLSDNWLYDRIDPTMRAIISLGVYELFFCLNTPHKVIIDEYVSIAGMFFNESNTGFVNGILDNLSKIIRV